MRRATKRTGKAKSSASATVPPAASAPEPDDAVTASRADDPVSFSDLSLHELFEQQARNMLERADLDEEQKQSILVAMACPCCGAGGMSLSVKLKNRTG